MVAVAVEREDGVDQVLDGAWASQVTVFGHVAHQDGGHVGGLGQPCQAFDAGADLGQAAGGLGELGVGDGLDGVDHSHCRPMAVDGRLDRSHVVALDGQEAVRNRSQAPGSGKDLGQRLLGRGKQDVGTCGGDRRQHLEEQCGLAHTGWSEEEGGRTGHQAAAEDPVQLADPGRQWARVVVGQGHVAQCDHFAVASRRRRAAAGGDHRGEGVPLAAARAPTRPLQSLRLAGGAHVEGCRSGHQRHCRDRVSQPLRRLWLWLHLPPATK